MTNQDDRITAIRHRYMSRSQIRRIDTLNAGQVQADVQVLLAAVDRMVTPEAITALLTELKALAYYPPASMALVVKWGDVEAGLRALIDPAYHQLTPVMGLPPDAAEQQQRLLASGTGLKRRQKTKNVSRAVAARDSA